MVVWYLIDRELQVLSRHSLKCLALTAAEDQDGGGYDYRTTKMRDGWWSVRGTRYHLIRADVYDRLRLVKRRRVRAERGAMESLQSA